MYFCLLSCAYSRELFVWNLSVYFRALRLKYYLKLNIILSFSKKKRNRVLIDYSSVNIVTIKSLMINNIELEILRIVSDEIWWMHLNEKINKNESDSTTIFFLFLWEISHNPDYKQNDVLNDEYISIQY